MKFVVSKTVLHKVLQNVDSALDTRPTKEIYSYVKIVAVDGKVSFVTTNGDMWATDEFFCEVLRSGSVATTMSVLFEIVKRFGNELDITCELHQDSNGGKLRLSTGNQSDFEISTISVADFPDVAHDEFVNSFEMASKDLIDIHKRISFCVSTNPARYNLTGMLFHTASSRGDSHHDTLWAVATDGHRLSYMKVPFNSAFNLPNRTVPRRAIVEIVKLVSQADKISLSFNETKLRVQFGSTSFVTKLIEAAYPEYSAVIPSNPTKILELDRNALSAALARVSVIYQIKGLKGVRFVASKDSLCLTTVNQRGDTAKEIIPAKFSDNETFEIAYNPVFISDVLSAVEGNVVRFCFVNEVSPSIIQSIDNSNYCHVVMPMKF